MQGCCGMVTIVTVEHGRHNFSPKMHIYLVCVCWTWIVLIPKQQKELKRSCFAAIKGETQRARRQWVKYALSAVLVCPGSCCRQIRPKQNLSSGFIYLTIYLMTILCIFSNTKMIWSETLLSTRGISSPLWALSVLSRVCCAGASLIECQSHGSVLQMMGNLLIPSKKMHQIEQ